MSNRLGQTAQDNHSKTYEFNDSRASGLGATQNRTLNGSFQKKSALKNQFGGSSTKNPWQQGDKSVEFGNTVKSQGGGNASYLKQGINSNYGYCKSSVQEDGYVTKLQSHKQFLEKSCEDLAKVQDDYRDRALAMLQKDDNPVVDHAIDSEFKFKDMRGKAVQEINNLLAIKIGSECEIKGLQAMKEWLSKYFEDAQEDFEEKDKFQKQISEKNKKEFQDSTNKNDQSNLEYADSQSRLKRLTNDYKKSVEEQFIKKFESDEQEKKFEEWADGEKQDEENKKHTCETLKLKIEFMNDKQNNNEELKKLLQEKAFEKEKLKQALYDEDEAKHRVLEFEKVCEVGAMRNRNDRNEVDHLKGELERLKQDYEDKLKQKESEVEEKAKKSTNKELKERKEEFEKFHKIKKELDLSLADKEKLYKKKYTDYRNLESEMLALQEMNDLKKLLVKDLQENIQNENSQYLKIKQDNDNKTKEYLQCGERFYELQIEAHKKISQQKYLRCKLKEVQERVKLEEELNKVKLNELNNVSLANKDFQKKIDQLQDNYNEMQEFARKPTR